MKLSDSVKALLQELQRSEHGLPDYVDRIGKTEELLVDEEPLSGDAGKAGWKREVREWAEIYKITGYSSVLHAPYRNVRVAVYREREYKYGNPEPFSSVARVEFDFTQGGAR
jgi:hypothetical protein